MTRSASSGAGADTHDANKHDADAFRAAELYYLHEQSQATIAAELKISVASVSRLLDYARSKQLVQFVLVPPFHRLLGQALEERLASRGVRKVLVTEADGRGVVGHAAAWHFEKTAPSSPTILLDGGWTVRDFVVAVPRQAHRAVTLLPVAADPPSYRISASELITLFASKCLHVQVHKVPHLANIVGSPLLKARHRKIKLMAAKADFIVLGIGPWKVNFTALDFVADLGLSPRTWKKRHSDIVAVSGYYPLSAQGDCVTIDDLETYLPHALPFEELRQIARRPDKQVLILAASADKCTAVTVALKARLCNTLVLDQSLAAALLERVSAGLD